MIANAGGTVTNSGTILGNTAASGGRGIRLIDGGTVSNQAGGTIAGYVGILDQSGGPAVDAAWRRFLDRAGARPGLPLTEDSDLHLVVDGKRVDASAREASALRFRLPPRRAAVRVVSRAGAPAELGLARDPRVLGVALRRVTLLQGPRCRVIEAADPALARGFHGFEPDDGLRWTDGDAELPGTLFHGFHGAVELLLHVGCTTRYPLLAAAAGRSAA